MFSSVIHSLKYGRTSEKIGSYFYTIFTLDLTYAPHGDNRKGSVTTN